MLTGLKKTQKRYRISDGCGEYHGFKSHPLRHAPRPERCKVQDRVHDKPENFVKQNLSDNQEPITCNLRYKKLKSKDILLDCISRMARSRRDAREAEGARLEIVYPANNGIEGSNPSLSARKFAEQILLLTFYL